jgi:nucleotide-binding universal stress UspA family protein
MTYNNILVPYDNSTPSETALDHAIKIAKMSSVSSSSANNNVNITLLHIVQNRPAPATFGTGRFKSKKTGDMLSLEQYLREISTEIEIDAKKMLEEKMKKIDSIGFTLHSKVLHGSNPAKEILKFSQSEKIDLIVMGNVGLRGISKIKILGSVSRNVLENAKCPVLIVH